MELVFESSPCAYLRRIVHETRTQEQTADVIVPDSCPDVERIVYASASAIVRSKECRAGSVVVSGGLRSSALYVPEGEQMPRVLDAYIPFSIRVDHPALTEQSQIVLTCGVAGAEARMLNSRKVLLRVNVCCTVDGFEPAELTTYTLRQQPPQLRVRCQEYPMLLPAATGEKSFAMSEELTLPSGSTMEQLCCYEAIPLVEERRIVADKAVFKGVLAVKVLYLDTTQTLRVLTQQLPFSQYCELAQSFDDDDAEVQVCMAVTGAQLEPDSTQDAQRLMLSMQLLAQCVVRTVQTVTACEDAYAIGAALEAQWQTEVLEPQLDAQTARQPLRGQLDADAQSVVDSTVYLGAPEQTRVDGGVQVRVPASVNVLYYDRAGALQGARGRVQAEDTVALAQQGRCVVQAVVEDSGYTAADGGGLEVRYACQLSVQTYAEQTLRTLCGGTLTPEEQRPCDRPSVIVRRCSARCALWDAAKKYGADAEAIRSANHLTGDELPEGQIVLIPL